MKHVSISNPAAVLGTGRTGAAVWDETQDMMQEGFRKFRRRKPRQNAQQPLEDQQDFPVAASAPFGISSELPPMGETDNTAQKGDTGSPLVAGHEPDDTPTPSQRLCVEPSGALPVRFEPWKQLPLIPFDFQGGRSSRLPLVSAFRKSPTARAFDLLRTRLLHSLQAHGWKRVAITSPTSGAGTTFNAVNLALSLARVPNSRTILMDFNFRKPGVAQALGIEAPGDLARLLVEEEAPAQHLQRLSETLAVATNQVANPDASDLLHDRGVADVLALLIEEMAADTVLFDLPPVLEHDDVAAFLPQVDGVLLISDGEQTTAAQLAACEKVLEGHAPLLGVVLNRAQQTDPALVTP